MKAKYYPIIIFILFLITFSSCNSSDEKVVKNTSNTVIFSDTDITKLPNNQVCMVNNRFMNSVQIAVPLNDKTYFGCCEGCVKMLKEDTASHFTIDALSGEQVDKAIAFIIGKPGSKEDVLYFKSEANAKVYFQTQLSTKKN